MGMSTGRAARVLLAALMLTPAPAAAQSVSGSVTGTATLTVNLGALRAGSCADR